MNRSYTQLFSHCKNFLKTNLLPLILCVASFNLFAMDYTSTGSGPLSPNSKWSATTENLFFENPPVETCESCAIPGVTAQTFITGAHAVIYAGRIYDEDECKTFFLYCIVNDGGTGGADISNTHFGDLNCANTCLDDESLTALGQWSVVNDEVVLDGACGEVEHGTDPNTNICGVKHDEESEGGCYEEEECSGGDFRVTHLYIAVNGNVAESTVTVGIKFGTETETLEVPGPGSCEDEGCGGTNDVPVAVDDVDSTTVNTPVVGLSQDNDTPSDDGGNMWMLIGANGGAANGTVTMTSTGTYTYTPNTGYIGVDVFVYKLCDIDTDCDTATVRITINPDTAGAPVPVQLLNFSVVKDGKTSLLRWTTGSEFNNDYFEIQRSIDNKNFITLGKVKGSGNSNTMVSYEYNDNTPHVGLNSYRLKQVDFDGRSTLSPIRMVNFDRSQAISIFPNPTTDELSVSLNGWDPELTTTIKVVDFNGAEVLTEEVTSETMRLNVSQLPVGAYFIQITNSAATQTYRFVKS